MVIHCTDFNSEGAHVGVNIPPPPPEVSVDTLEVRVLDTLLCTADDFPASARCEPGGTR